jgi:class 3 adenylate cyclase
MASDPNRRLAAVMFLDMVAYSAMMSRDQARALRCVKALEELLRAEVPAAGGRLVKFLGDGSMAEFPTAGAAVDCAKRLLSAVAERKAASPDCAFDVRIGLHLGELVEDKGDLFGDAVNIAARVQPLADPGGIAMTGTVHDQIKNLGALRGAYLSPQKLKNIPTRTQIFLVPPAGASYLAWALRKKGLPLALPAALLAVLAAGSWFAWKRYQSEPLRVVYLLVKSVDGDEASVKMAHDLEDELNDRGARLHGVSWTSRVSVLQLLYRRGLTDPEKLMRAESGACLIAHDLGLKLAIAGRLKRAGKGWRLETGVTDVTELAVVGNFDAEGADATAVAEDVLRHMQAWIDEYESKGKK